MTSKTVRWTHYLYKNESNGKDYLFEKDEGFGGQFVVCHQAKVKRFAAFPYAQDFINFFLEQNSDLHYFEVIQGNKPFKFFFDVDMEVKKEGLELRTELLLNDMLDVVVAKWAKWTGQSTPFDCNKDIIIYTSHTKDPNDEIQKRSFHFIFPRLIVLNMKVAKAVYDDFHDDLNQMSDWFDDSVYKSTQQLRIVYNSKFGKGRIKIPLFQWKTEEYSGTYTPYVPKIDIPNYNNEVLWFSRVIEESLVSFVDESLPLYKCSFMADAVISQVRSLDFQVSAFIILPDLLPKAPEGFEIAQIEKDLIHLKRKKPTHCPICQRTHDHQNAFFRWSPDDDQWYFGCWQGRNSSLRDIPFVEVNC